MTEIIEPSAKAVLHFGCMAWKLTHSESNERGGFVRHWESYACTIPVYVTGRGAQAFYHAGAECFPTFDAAIKSACRQHALNVTAAHEILRRACPDMLRDGGDVKGLDYFNKRFPIH